MCFLIVVLVFVVFVSVCFYSIVFIVLKFYDLFGCEFDIIFFWVDYGKCFMNDILNSVSYFFYVVYI